MSLSSSGSRDWVIQRFSAIFLAFYTLYLFYFFITNPGLQYSPWQELFSMPMMQIGSLFALICMAFHTWIGLWTVLTDYVKPVFLRYLLQFLIVGVLFWYVIWGVWILWGI